MSYKGYLAHELGEGVEKFAPAARNRSWGCMFDDVVIDDKGNVFGQLINGGHVINTTRVGTLHKGHSYAYCAWDKWQVVFTNDTATKLKGWESNLFERMKIKELK